VNSRPKTSWINNARKRQFDDREKRGILQKNCEKLIVTLENVKFVPELWIDLFIIGKALKNGFNLSNNGEIIKFSKEM
jgi:hypothetical protein